LAAPNSVQCLASGNLQSRIAGGIEPDRRRRARLWGDERPVGACRLQGLLTEHTPFPVISAVPVAEFPARLALDQKSDGANLPMHHRAEFDGHASTSVPSCDQRM